MQNRIGKRRLKPIKAERACGPLGINILALKIGGECTGRNRFLPNNKIDQNKIARYGLRLKKRRVELGLLQTEITRITGLIDPLTFSRKFAIIMRNLE
jgi:hypothetical protein